MEKLTEDYKSYFRAGRLLASQDQPLTQLPPAEMFDGMKDAVQQLLTALSVLHEEGFVAGSITPQSFVVGVDGVTRLRLLPTVFRRRDESEPEYDTFNPAARFLAPERLVAIGKDNGFTARQIYKFLFEKNPTFERMSAVFPTLRHDFGQYQALYDEESVDPEQEDVWMLANALLSVYVDLLTYDDVFATEFYREEHERFMDLLEAMLQTAPSERLTARKALLAWLGQSYELDFSGDDDETGDDDGETAAEQPAAEPPQPEPVGAESSPPSNPDPQTTPLPVPDAHPRRGGRNRTRKNLRNSGRSSASGSRARRSRG
jgi:hypothetical protein